MDRYGAMVVGLIGGRGEGIMNVRDALWQVHLVELASELNDLGFDSVVRLPPGRRASLEVFVPPGRPRHTGKPGVNGSEPATTRQVRAWARGLSRRFAGVGR
ncbi:hypothetical protein AB0B89_34635 [Sphaerisporangium sp. NPDC049002]|uniref:hypothetical protein n=1 Tax=Sphaerisporangium sp. NPDC049002 TaxID=3155392 RepID=UPI00340E1F2A